VKVAFSHRLIPNGLRRDFQGSVNALLTTVTSQREVFALNSRTRRFLAVCLPASGTSHHRNWIAFSRALENRCFTMSAVRMSRLCSLLAISGPGVSR